ncbi:hypothetical protein DY000_02013064 [Brassica cretica]|uniref:Uncharacterized protein n=1 Tax=Brassica cretica TaxID=69181 RepID=A0ABQ7CS04_BRACR|nr:hypothetical protein DY000_02013064 [Brassica cretica]
MTSSLIVGNPISEEVRGYALTTTTKTKRRLSDGRRGCRSEELERQKETFSRSWLKLRGINEFCGDAN